MKEQRKDKDSIYKYIESLEKKAAEGVKKQKQTKKTIEEETRIQRRRTRTENIIKREKQSQSRVGKWEQSKKNRPGIDDIFYTSLN